MASMKCGYLAQGASHEAYAASHAWADAYVEHLGWVSFDPSNRTCATESYIRTAIGLDYAEAGPIRGIRSGGGVEPGTSLTDAVKCALISFDSTMRSNVSVGPPIDLLVYRRNSLSPGFSVRLEGSDPYLRSIRDAWGNALHKAFQETVPDPGWTL